MKSTIYLILLIAGLHTANPAFAQYGLMQNMVWALPDMAGIDFRSGTPVPITSALVTQEGATSLADNDGFVLYTNGTNVWNRNHQIMPHGQNINSPDNNSVSSSQSSVIVPCMESAADNTFNAYYLFTITEEWSSPNGNLFCNKIDMSLDGGAGDVDTTFYLHSIPLDNFLAEKIIVIPGCKNNFWVVVHTAQAATFKAYEVTQAGINLIPVVSTSGSGLYYTYGVMKVNTLCNKIVTCLANSNMGLEVHDFDITTGIVSNGSPLDPNSGTGYYGACFSPSGSKVYARRLSGFGLYQFDLNATDPAATKTYIGQVGALPLSDIALGPDGKVYFHAATATTANTAKFLGCINYPDNAGIACGYESYIPSLYFPDGIKGGMHNTFFLPQQIQMELSGNVYDSVICNFPSSGVALTAPDNMPLYRWEDGTAQQTRVVNQPGLYWVKYTVGHCTTKTDSFHVRANEMTAPVILFSNNTLSTTTPYFTYQWYKDDILLNGSTTQSCVSSGAGWYSVKVTGPGGCADSAAYQVTGTGTGIVQRQQSMIRIFPNPAGSKVAIQAPCAVRSTLFSIEGRQLTEATGGQEIDLKPFANGLYFLHIRDTDDRLLKVEKLLVKHEH